MSFEEEHEQTLLQIRECFVYRIPTRKSAGGYRASDWDVNNFIWSGRLTVVSKGPKCTIKLEDSNSGEAFAICPVDATAVEPVVDSSRYFVLKIQDGQGRHAFVGMGFTERNEAFDFNAALQDHEKHVRNQKELENQAAKLASMPKIDLSLKEGQSIHVNLKTNKPISKPTSTTTGETGFGLLPPPPSGKRTNPTTVTTSTKTSQSDIWGDFTSSGGSDWTAFQ